MSYIFIIVLMFILVFDLLVFIYARTYNVWLRDHASRLNSKIGFPIVFVPPITITLILWYIRVSGLLVAAYCIYLIVGEISLL